jgi:glycosyltransferase involved in cell wall biosynthesis
MSPSIAPLRILVTADPELPVPPLLYGGIERIIDLLVNGLIARGHEVTLVAHRESASSATLVPYPTTSSRGIVATIRHSAVVTRAAMRFRPHVIQSFGRVAYLMPLLTSSAVKVMSYQRAVTPRTARWATRLARGTLTWTACSRHVARPVEQFGTWRVIYNGVPTDRLPFTTSVPADAPLMFLGRIERIKGTHVAIDVARSCGRTLVIAGNVPEDREAQDYFRTSVEPHLDGTRVIYVGPVDDERKSKWLTRASALLMPIQWDEPFGIVMAEALASGTPVIGIGRGAVSEVIDEGVTGFVCTGPEDMVAAVARLPEISRLRCRRMAEDRFSHTSLVNAYESLYRDVLSMRTHPAGPAHQVAAS